MRTILAGGCLLLASVLCLTQDRAVDAKEKAALDKGQNVLISTFDSALPKVSLRYFLESESDGAKINWEVNDCGEQTGDPAVDRERDVPTCVEASFTLKDKRTIDVMVAVGSVKTGLAIKPTLFSCTITDENGTRTLKLIELPAQIHRGRPQAPQRNRDPDVGNRVS